MRLSLLFLFAVFMLAGGCNKKMADTSATPEVPSESSTATKTVVFGGEQLIKIGETCSVEKSKASIKFLNVLEDSRCPKGVNCIQPGEAVIMVEVAGTNRRLIIDTDPKTKTRTTIEGGTVEILSLAPYPDARVRIDPAQRAIRIRVEKGEKMK